MCSLHVTASRFESNVGVVASALYVHCNLARCNVILSASTFLSNGLVDAPTPAEGVQSSTVLVVGQALATADGSQDPYTELPSGGNQLTLTADTCLFSGAGTWSGSAITVTAAQAKPTLLPELFKFDGAVPPNPLALPTARVDIGSCAFSGFQSGIHTLYIMAPRSLTIRNTSIFNCTGALMAQAAANVTIQDSDFSGNTAGELHGAQRAYDSLYSVCVHVLGCERAFAWDRSVQPCAVCLS
jgi:hypothetical protein